jgi:hypothetical protein
MLIVTEMFITGKDGRPTSRFHYAELALPALVMVPIRGGQADGRAMYMGLAPSVGHEFNQIWEGEFNWVAERMATWAGKHMQPC